MEINLWLDDDDRRRPPICGIAWTWVRSADEAIAAVDVGNVVWASLDHDLADEHYFHYLAGNQGKPDFKEKTGMSVLEHMQEHNLLPKYGVRVHTMNESRKKEMLELVKRSYGRTFQVQYPGTHFV